ncbi:MAG TPA: DUF5640 domain-containing protein [Oscillospiraceae bacterium]|nr:DUF5640 domain-containing protein [Oscillospiraceae bacterium]
MTKKRTAVVLLSMIMLLSLLLAACGGGGGGSGGGGDALKGTWEGMRDSTGITFKFDGKGGCDTEDEYGIKDTGTYTIVDDSTVKIKMSYWDNEIAYNYSISGDKLVMDSDEPLRPAYDLTKTR